MLQVPTLGSAESTLPALGLAVLMIVGLCVAFRLHAARWLAAAMLATMALYSLAAGSNSDFAKLATGLWYKDAYRLSSLLVVTAVPIATLGMLWVADRVALLTAARRRLRAVGMVLTVAVLWASSWVVVAVAADKQASADLLDQSQIDFLSSIGDIVPAGERMLGDPWDGSAMSWLYAGLEPVFPHVNGYWDADRSTILNSLTNIGSDPAVCEALERLNVHYVLYNPVEFLGGDPAGNAFGSIHEAVETGVFTDVAATDGVNVLYRIDQCG